MATTEALPKGLVINTANVGGDIESIDRVEIEDIQQLWRGTACLSSFPMVEGRQLTANLP